MCTEIKKKMRDLKNEPLALTSSPRAMIVHLRVNKYSTVTGQSGWFFGVFFFTILVMFQVYGCNSFHRIIGPVNAYLRPSCHFFPCKSLCFQN